MGKSFDEARRQVLRAGGGAVALATLGAHAPAQAAVITVDSQESNLSSNADRMISYRFQERMWQTSDRLTHLMANRGSLHSGGALTLCTSTTNGLKWTVKLRLPDTDRTSTCDGFMTGNQLTLVYSDDTGRIRLTFFTYDPATVTWTRGTTELVYGGPSGVIALSPAVVRDAAGAYWCCYVVQETATERTWMTVSFRARASGSNWGDSGFMFGDVDISPDVERAGRPVLIPGGVGIVYTWHDDIRWATRRDGTPPTSPWMETLLWRSDPPGSGGRGEFGGHFSVVADDNGNYHMSTVDAGRLVYLRYLGATGLWDPLRPITGDVTAAYSQITYSGGRLMMMVNVKSQVQAYQSADLGSTFRLVAKLVHPAPTGSLDYSSPLLESPGRSYNPIPVMQLYSNGPTYGLLQFSLPLAKP